MQKVYKPVIVVIAFERLHSLKRILSSLYKSSCPDGVKLIISIDNNGKNTDVVDLANKYVWKNGEKEVIYHNERLGLRDHIVKCGDLALKYDSIILLEDDLYVSPYFYTYAQDALNYYDESTGIGGISLYNLPYTESAKLPFIPLNDNSDVYFKKVPSSLGQAWTSKQWIGFKEWYNKKPDLKNVKGLPYIAKVHWPDSSWKKYYYAYLIESNKYFVFPQVSFTTNFNDLGSNIVSKSYFRQVQLKLIDSPTNFIKLEDSISVYDGHSEIKPEIINKLSKALCHYDVEIDLYGKKEFFTKDYVLTSKPCKNVIAGYARNMKPHEMNIIFNNRGNDFFLAKTEDVLSYPGIDYELKYNNYIKDFIVEYSYFYNNVFDLKFLLRLTRYRIIAKLKSKFGL